MKKYLVFAINYHCNIWKYTTTPPICAIASNASSWRLTLTKCVIYLKLIEIGDSQPSGFSSLVVSVKKEEIDFFLSLFGLVLTGQDHAHRLGFNFHPKFCITYIYSFRANSYLPISLGILTSNCLALSFSLCVTIRLDLLQFTLAFIWIPISSAQIWC